MTDHRPPSPLGVICLHGLGGAPSSVAPLVDALRAGGHVVESPALVGHGARAEDLLDIRWPDWVDAVDVVASTLRERVEALVVVGQSMGATVGLALATQRDDVIGVAAINPVFGEPDPDATEFLTERLARGRTMQPNDPPDLRDPEARDTAYAELPLRSLLEMGVGSALVTERIGSFRGALLVVSADHDAVIDPANADQLAQAARAATVSRLRLPNSGHVAALDLDRELLGRALLDWLADLTDQSAPPA